MRTLLIALVVFLVTSPVVTLAGPQVLLSAPFISGSTRYSTTDLAESFASKIGQPVSRRLIDEITADIQSRYRRDGYVAPAIIALDSELGSSTPRIHVFEAGIDEIALRGNAGPYVDTIMDRAHEMQSGTIDRRRTQSFIRGLNELPGLRVRATFEPRGSTLNRMTLVLDAKYEAVEGAMSISNRGTEELGRMLASARITANGVLGTHSAASVYGATSNETDRYQFLGAGVEHAFSSANVAVDFAESRAEHLSGYEYRSQRGRMEIRSLQDVQSLQVSPFLAFTWRDAQGRYPDLEISDIRTRFAEIGAMARHSGELTFAQVRAGFARGLDAFGARAIALNGNVSDLTFSKTSLDTTLVHALAARWRLRVDVEGQWSNSDLPAGERFTFGGATWGRAFDPAELIGDSGAAVSLQLEHVQSWRQPWLRQSSVYLQGDYGYARDNEFGGADAASLTAGIRASFASMLTKLELSTPLMRAYDDSTNSVRAFAQVQLTF
jgi:hemolysin activation/secretion protein